MDDITWVRKAKVRKAISLFKWMDKDRLSRCGEQPARLRDNGPTEPLLLDRDLHYSYEYDDVETLCELGFLRRDRGEFKLTDKADRLVRELNRKESEGEMVGRALDWIVVIHGEVFIDEGANPPNLRALIGEQWEPGDRIVITCHEPDYLLVNHLPLGLAGGDSLFETDLHEVAADFK